MKRRVNGDRIKRELEKVKASDEITIEDGLGVC
jgi:hypothetical protein